MFTHSHLSFLISPLITLCLLSGVCSTRETSAAPLPIEEGSWTLAVLPDTQHYVDNASNHHHFTAQTQWIADHAESHNIKYVLHEGDITNNNNTTQWNRAKQSLDILNGKVPYALAPGNHDYGPNGNAGDRTSLYHNAGYYGTNSFYANQPTVGGFFESGKTDNSYHTFNAGGQDWLVLALEWGPRDEVVTWANQVVSDHSDHKAMLVTHAYMYYDETIYDWATKGSSQSWNPHGYGVANLPGESVNDGQELWDKLVSQHENFHFTFNGHVLGDGTGFRSTAGVNGNPVHQMLANYQMNPQGGQADMRLLEFKPDGNTVVVRTYSPSLDRYDTDYDQEFTLKLDQLHAPLTPPPPPFLGTVVAANMLVTGPTDPSANTVSSVSFPQSSSQSVGHLQVNRGDYEVSIDRRGLQYQHGVMLATVRENVREGLRGTVEIGRNSFGDGQLALSVMETGNSGNNELNINTAVAWFQFTTGWQAGHVDSGGGLNPVASNRVDPSMLTKTGVGRYHLDLGVDSNADGLLFTTGNNNDNILVQTGVLPDGSWDIRVEDNATNFSATGEDADFSFVYLPYDTKELVGGLYEGMTDSHKSSVGDFTMTRTGTGQYELTIEGETPETGMLLLTVARQASVGSVSAPDDNVLTYQDNGNGAFLINSLDLPSVSLQNTTFAWAFISFDKPISPNLTPGDYDRDGDVDTDDFSVWQSQYGATGALGELSADGSGDGVVDGVDYAVWREAFAESTEDTDAATAAPESASWYSVVIVLAVFIRAPLCRASLCG